MKRPQPDIGDILLSDFLSNTSTVRKLLKYWGVTTTETGVRVLTPRKYYYPWDPDNEKLFKFLGCYDEVSSGEYDGIDSAWLYLNKNRSESLEFDQGTTLEEFITRNLNLMWWDPEDGVRPENLTLTTTILVEGLLQSSTSSSTVTTAPTTTLLNPLWPTQELIDAISNSYETLWDTCLISQQGVGVINKGSITDPVTKITAPDEDDLTPNDPWLQTIARYALRNNTISYTIKDVEIGYGQLENTRLQPTYAVTVEIPYVEFFTTDTVVADIAADISADYSSRTRTKLSYPNGYYTQQAIRALDASDLELDETLVSRPYTYWEDVTSESVGTLDDIWYGKHLRAEVLENPRAHGLTFKALSTYLLPLVDMDYKKKKVPVWKKIVAVVVFIIAVVLSLWSGGWSLGLVAVAKAILVGVLVLAVFSLVLAKMGLTELATAFASVNKTLEPLAWAAMIVMIWTGITNLYAAAQNTGTTTTTAAGAGAVEAGTAATVETGVVVTAETGAVATTGTVATTGIAETVVNMAKTAVQDYVSSIIQGAIDLSTIQLTPAAINLLTSLVKVVDTMQSLRLEEINDRNKDLKAEYEKMTADGALENDILQGFARLFPSPATADWSIYASLYDLPYERTGGFLHTGNVQRTTKQALRKADYEDLVFANILLV